MFDTIIILWEGIDPLSPLSGSVGALEQEDISSNYVSPLSHSTYL